MTASAANEQVDRLRMALTDFFHRLPEVPVYRRRDDPAIKQAAERAEEGRALLETAKALGDAPGAETLRAALVAHLEVLDLLKAGRVEAAEGPWHRALSLERDAISARRLWSRTDEVRPPVYEAETGASRFDPRPEAAVKVKLACPGANCHKVEDFDFSARHATHLFVCPHCKLHFYAYFAELISLSVETRSKTHHRYRFQIRELNGATTRVDFDDGGEAQLAAARGDLLAFLYSPRTMLRGVLDLSSSRVLWVRSVGPCFLATAVFGEEAPELFLFRHFRDVALLPSAPGRVLVRGYYALGPGLARWVKRHPPAQRLTRRMLTGIHRLLSRAL
jgi:hypothetical protein